MLWSTRRKTRLSVTAALSFCLMSNLLFYADSFSQSREAAKGLWDTRTSFACCASESPTSDLNGPAHRRQFLQYTSAAVIVGSSQGCGASTEKVSSKNDIAAAANLDCLLDLPPVANNSVRLYLCRHGQTENNRLRLVQGARVDPPLNSNGEAMARNLGWAFARLEKDKLPKKIVHSNMLRAMQTAEIASKQIHSSTELETFQSLTEVDFGPTLEGKKVSQARAEMAGTYGAWATGFIDTRPKNGGESGREVLTRVVEALSMLTQAAARNGGSIVAVSHSTYLRMLLALVMDVSLARVATLPQANGCVNVIDIDTKNRERTLDPKCNLFGGPMSQAPDDFQLRINPCKVVRLNESRHLKNII